jgi:hypothetical protein
MRVPVRGKNGRGHVISHTTSPSARDSRSHVVEILLESQALRLTKKDAFMISPLAGCGNIRMSDVVSAFDTGTHNMDDWEGEARAFIPSSKTHQIQPEFLEYRATCHQHPI